MKTITCLIHEDKEYPNKCIACKRTIIPRVTASEIVWHANDYNGFLCDNCGDIIQENLTKVEVHYKRYRASKVIAKIIQQVTFHSGSQPYFLKRGTQCIIQMSYGHHSIQLFDIEEQSVICIDLPRSLYYKLEFVQSSPPDFKVSSILKWLEGEDWKAQ